MPKEPQFSRLESLATLQKELRILVDTTPEDEELVAKAVPMLLGSLKPVTQVIYFHRLLLYKRRSKALDILNHRMQAASFCHPAWLECEYRWIWSRGWREFAFRNLKGIYKLFSTPQISALLCAMEEEIQMETQASRDRRLTRIAVVPSWELPFLPQLFKRL